MNKKTLKNLGDLKSKIVLVRVDFNVPLKNGKVENNARIKAALPTIKYLMEKEAKIVLFSHLGRITSEKDKEHNSMEPVANELAHLLKVKVIFVPKTRGKELESSIQSLENGQILVFENTRFEDFTNGKLTNYESKNNNELAKYWSLLGDVFVNDAFGTAHRSHASNVGIATHIKDSAIGFLIEKEVEFLHNAIDKPKHPFIALIGGAKVSDKIDIIESLAQKADKVIIGTAMCYTFNLALGKTVGDSLAEPNKVDLANMLIKKYGDKLIIAKDYIVVDEFKDKKGKEVFGNIPDGMMGMDIGTETIKEIKETLKGAKTVLWNGPFGVTEFKHFRNGSKEIAKTLVKLKDATTIIGGGDSAAMAISMGIEKKISHISTGGGASIEFLEGKVLPGISVIQDKE